MTGPARPTDRVRAAVRTSAVRDAVEREYLLRSEPLFEYLRANGLRTGRDILALASSRGRARAHELLTSMQAGADLDLDALRRYVTLVVDQADTTEAKAEALALLEAFADRYGVAELRKDGRFRLLELRAELEPRTRLEDQFARLHIRRDDLSQASLVEANAAQALWATAGSEAEGEWLRIINEMFARDGLEPIALAPGPGAPLDRILAGAGGVVRDGPLVTIVLPTYAPGPRLATAVESLISQSYRPLQILIVDDASPADSAAALDRWPERDPRIQVIHLSENGGPYLARNIAVSEYARGDYVIIHDDDDWSHPRHIELQVAQLESDASLAANMVNSVRVSDDLRFGRINGNPVWTQHALSSTMIRRSVFDAIGYWDVLNRAGDSEFNDRIRAWTSGRIPAASRVPVRFYRVRWDSLSAGEFNRGYTDARRRWYYQSYISWHQHEVAQGRAPHVPVDNRGQRSFSAPADLLGSRQGRVETSVDVLIAGDYRVGGDRIDELCEQIDALLAAGTRVGILQMDSPTAPPDARVRPQILKAAMHADARIVSLRDAVDSDALVVFDPSTLQFAERLRTAIDARRVVIIDWAQHRAAPGGAVYEAEDVLAAAQELFGRTPQWLDPETRPTAIP